jgi:hypothetical protein
MHQASAVIDGKAKLLLRDLIFSSIFYSNGISVFFVNTLSRFTLAADGTRLNMGKALVDCCVG